MLANYWISSFWYRLLIIDLPFLCSKWPPYSSLTIGLIANHVLARLSPEVDVAQTSVGMDSTVDRRSRNSRMMKFIQVCLSRQAVIITDAAERLEESPDRVDCSVLQIGVQVNKWNVSRLPNSNLSIHDACQLWIT